MNEAATAVVETACNIANSWECLIGKFTPEVVGRILAYTTGYILVILLLAGVAVIISDIVNGRNII